MIYLTYRYCRPSTVAINPSLFNGMEYRRLGCAVKTIHPSAKVYVPNSPKDAVGPNWTECVYVPSSSKLYSPPVTENAGVEFVAGMSSKGSASSLTVLNSQRPGADSGAVGESQAARARTRRSRFMVGKVQPIPPKTKLNLREDSWS